MEGKAAKAHQLGLEPRVALLSYSNFGNLMGRDVERVRDAVGLLDQRRVGFEYDGEMSADVALDEGLMRRLYPCCRLAGPANILVVPELHSTNIAAKLLPQLGGGTVVGPLLLGLSHPSGAGSGRPRLATGQGWGAGRKAEEQGEGAARAECQAPRRGGARRRDEHRSRNSWRWVETRDDARKLHPDMLLPEREKGKDRNTIRRHRDFAVRAGFRVVPIGAKTPYCYLCKFPI
jgi:hypothetical protein